MSTIEGTENDDVGVGRIRRLMNVAEGGVHFCRRRNLLGIRHTRGKCQRCRATSVTELRRVGLFQGVSVSVRRVETLFRGEGDLRIYLRRRLKRLRHHDRNLIGVRRVYRHLVTRRRSLSALGTRGYLRRVRRVRGRNTEFVSVGGASVHGGEEAKTVVKTMIVVLLVKFAVKLVL